MFKKALTSITVSSELFHIEPIQHYIGYLAELCTIHNEKVLHIKILIEEVFSHIVSGAFKNSANGSINIDVIVTRSTFTLRFHYLGFPFGYNIEKTADIRDEISLKLIKELSSSYKMFQMGKEGQIVEINIALPLQLNEKLYANNNDSNSNKPIIATDKVTLKEIDDGDMEMLVQCLYNVFGYTYSADGIYYPNVILERKHQGIYKGFVAVNETGVIVAHVGMLKDNVNSVICESGQAFVSPQYGKRGLFNKLKAMLLKQADIDGLYGTCSSAVTGHPFTQKANIELGCIETGLELSYIPSDLKSNIPRYGQQQRQSVLTFFYPSSHKKEEIIYIPKQHKDIIIRTYQKLNIQRTFAYVDENYSFKAEESEIDFKVKTEWNQLHLSIKTAGYDLVLRVKNVLRQSIVGGAAVCYVSLNLTEEQSPLIVKTLENIGFFYAGINPYELEGNDAIKMQYLLDTSVSKEYVIAESDWGKEIKEYVFSCKEKADNIINRVI